MQDTSHPQERARWRAGSSATILTGPLLIFGPAMSGSLPIIVIANAIDDKGIQTLIKGGATMPGWMSDIVLKIGVVRQGQTPALMRGSGKPLEGLS